MDQVKIGKFIAECRKRVNLTQAQLAEKLNITDRAVSKWETGKSLPDASIMKDLCNNLKICSNIVDMNGNKSGGHLKGGNGTGIYFGTRWYGKTLDDTAVKELINAADSRRFIFTAIVIPPISLLL